MLKEFIEGIKNIEKNIFKTMVNGLKISLGFCILATIILITYIIKPISPITYQAGLILFKTGITLSVFCFLCSFVFDKLQKGII